jgi:hypothetical protein
MSSNLNDRVPRDQAKIPNVRNWAVRDHGNRVGVITAKWQGLRCRVCLPPVEERGFEPAVPRLPVSSVQLRATRPTSPL